MDQFLLKINSKVSICSFSNKRYLKNELDRRVSCTSCHPFMLQSIEEKAKCSFMVSSGDEISPNQTDLAFCSSVFIISDDGSYLTSDPSGLVTFENIESKSYQTQEPDRSLMKFRRWTLINRSSLISKKVIVTTDEVLIKSHFGNYLKIEGTSVVANSSVIEDKTSFHFHQIDFLPLPDWAILRPLQSNLILSSLCSKLFFDNELFFQQSVYKGSKVKQELNFDSIHSAQRAVVEETLYCLMSVEGNFIKRKYKDDNSFYTFENNKDFDTTFVHMVNRILPLASLHDRIKLFEELRGGMNKGLIYQAFCGALSKIRTDFYSVLVVIEKDFADPDSKFDLQKFWTYLQEPFKIFQLIEKILTEIECQPDLSLLTILFNFLCTAIDE